MSNPKPLPLTEIHHGENGAEATRGMLVGNSPESPLSIKLKAIVADLRGLADELEKFVEA